MGIHALGFDDWFGQRLQDDLTAVCRPARVSAVHRDGFVIIDGQGEVRAEVSGKMMFQADSPLDYPVVGDWVQAQYVDGDSMAIIHAVLPRKSFLHRKTAGGKVDYQPIAANVDTALIVQALDRDFNPRRLERYLVMVAQGDVQPLVVLSKTDLVTPEELALHRQEAVRLASGADVVGLSNLAPGGLDALQKTLRPGRTYCLLGSSGVGKTALLNNLLGDDRFQTRAVRRAGGKGRHTTTVRQMSILDSGVIIIDTPGMRELGHLDVEAGLGETFGEIDALAENCRFVDCSHTVEKGCAVLAALADGSISQKRYDNYMKIAREAARHEMSLAERRRQDKDFGKMVKSVVKRSPKKPR
jgi:ribosome biogenesis GTPase